MMNHLSKILVVNALNGVFPLVLRKKYPSAKITCAEVFPFYKHHLVNLGFEVVDWEGLQDVKFDMIVGNPPYQDTENGKRKSQNMNLWSKFIDKCASELLAQDGYLMLVVPASWAGPTANLSKGRRILKDILACNDTLAISLDPGLTSFFPGVGSTFSWFCMRKAANTGKTKIFLDKSKSITVDLSGMYGLPRINHELAYSINKKYFAKKNRSIIPPQKCKDQYSETPNQVYKYPAYHTPAKGGRLWYMKEKHINHDIPKIIISLSGYYKPVSDQGSMGYTDMCLAYLIPPGETLESAMSVFDSAMFHFIMRNNRWSGFNNNQIIRQFPLPTLDRIYTNQEIFDWFSLTPEECEFITQYLDTKDISS